MKRIIFVTAVIAALATLSTIEAQEKKLKREQLPAPVQATVDRVSKDATIKGFSTEKENGVRLYEAELEVNGHSRDVSIAENGDVIEIEEQVALDSLPAAVKDAIKKEAGGGTIRKIESITKGDQVVAYEADIKDGKKHREVKFGPAGEKLAH